MDFDRIFKVVVVVLFVLAIVVYATANRYQFFHITNSLTGISCDRYTGKCEWLSPEEMGKEKIMKYSEKQRGEMERQIGPQGQAPDKPQAK